MAIHSVLSTIMGTKRISQRKLAEMTGLSRSTIGAIYNDKYRKFQTLDKLCKALDCNVSDILTYVPDEKE